MGSSFLQPVRVTVALTGIPQRSGLLSGAWTARTPEPMASGPEQPLPFYQASVLCRVRKGRGALARGSPC